ncbi:MAG: hypothetical protein J6C12_11865 [Lachnospiraceae bacterium]|nr:hypothetical protein [Lachnospiraceae bacterium]
MTLFDGVFSLNDIFEILTIIGLIYYVVKRFILKEAPVPASALKKVDEEKLRSCLTLLQKSKKEPGEIYAVPKELEEKLLVNLHDTELLKQLLCSIAAHMGIDGSYIRLKFQDDANLNYAGNISTNGAFTIINLQLHSYYNLDVITAILSHEVMHLYLYYSGIHFSDTLSNEVLTDTAAVYFGFGEYLYRGYQIIETQMGFSYQKVGYIRPRDVKFIQEEMRNMSVK